MTATVRLDLAGLTAKLTAFADEVDRTRRAPLEGLAALGRRGLLGGLIPRAFGGLELSPPELQARCENGRILVSSDATRVTGAPLITHSLVSAQDAATGGVLMAVIPAAELSPGPPNEMVAVTNGMNCTVMLRDVEVTDRLLAAPPDRAQTRAVFTQNKAPRDAGF